MSKNPAKPQLVERAVRFNLSGLHQIDFKIFMNGTEHKCTLRNLSTLGMAFDFEDAENVLKMNQILKSKITLDGEVFSLTLNVRHLTSGSVGCRLEGPDHRFQEVVEQFFVDEISAANMTEVPKEITDKKFKTVSDGEAHYFEGANNSCALYYVEKTGRIKSMWLTLLGNTVEIDNEGQIIYGFMLEGESMGLESTVRVKVHDLPDEIINHALRFVWNIQKIPSNIKHDIASILEHSRHKKSA